MVANGTQNAYPLSGIRVVDFCWVYAGPLMTRTLADYGAEVIKVESHKRLDGTRLGRPIIGDDITKGDEGLQPELQPLYHALNRNKHSITIDIREETGRKLIHDLIAVSDVVTDNFSAGVLDRLGFGYEALRKIKPDIICASLSGAGQYGPLKDVPVYANTLGPLSGVGLLLGYQPDKPMGASQFAWGDACATIRGVGAIAMALYHRKRTGEGQYIDVSRAGLQYLRTGRAPAGLSNERPGGGPPGEHPPGERAQRHLPVRRRRPLDLDLGRNGGAVAGACVARWADRSWRRRRSSPTASNAGRTTANSTRPSTPGRKTSPTTT